MANCVEENKLNEFTAPSDEDCDAIDVEIKRFANNINLVGDSITRLMLLQLHIEKLRPLIDKAVSAKRGQFCVTDSQGTKHDVSICPIDGYLDVLDLETQEKTSFGSMREVSDMIVACQKGIYKNYD